MNDLKSYDAWLDSDHAAAIVIREPLVSVDGSDGVLFPATFAVAEDKKFPGGYNIDPPEGDKNVCLVDSVGSQANRIEPIFSKPEYAHLVPQIVIQAGEKKVSLLEAGHRAGDAIVRCTSLQRKIQDAFRDVLRGNSLALAKIAPTSLVFGVWDSRDTQAKLPRLIASTVRAFDVQRLTRGAVYLPTLQYVNEGLVDEALDTGSGKDNLLSKNGYKHNPASASHGGVVAKGGVRRDVTFSLAALRLLSVGDDPKATQSLRRYILGLSLVALTAPAQTYLRQGCNLVPDIEHPRTFVLVNADGTRSALDLSHQQALAYAKLAAADFGVGASETVPFDPEAAKTDILGEGDKAPTKKSRAKNKSTAAAKDEATEQAS
jgi:CRISPR-associated protein Csb1